MDAFWNEYKVLEFDLDLDTAEDAFEIETMFVPIPYMPPRIKMSKAEPGLFDQWRHQLKLKIVVEYIFK